MRAATIFLLLGLLGCTSSPPPTTPAQAMKEHLERADAARREGKLDAALREYRYVHDIATESELGARARDAIVAIEIARIARGDNLRLPQPSIEPPPSASAHPETLLLIENRSGGRVYLYVKGVTSSLAEAAPGGAVTLSLLPGEHEVGVRGDDPSALPFYGHHIYNVGALYRISLGPSPSPR